MKNQDNKKKKKENMGVLLASHRLMTMKILNRTKSCLSYIALALVLGIFGGGLSSLSAQYDSYDYTDRFSFVYGTVPIISVNGSGFRDVQISDHNGTSDDSMVTPRAPKVANVNLSDANYDNEFRNGVGVGIGSIQAFNWGFGGEFEFIGFENPQIWQVAGFLNYGVIGAGGFIVGPYAKFGYTSMSVELTEIERDDSELVELSRLERFQGKNAVDIGDGNKLRTTTNAIFVQFGLHFAFRAENNLVIFCQAGYHNEIDIFKGLGSDEALTLELEGTRKEEVTDISGNPTGETATQDGTFEIEIDDQVLVNKGTQTPARLDPTLETGPWYFSVGIGFPF